MPAAETPRFATHVFSDSSTSYNRIEMLEFGYCRIFAGG